MNCVSVIPSCSLPGAVQEGEGVEIRRQWMKPEYEVKKLYCHPKERAELFLKEDVEERERDCF